MADIDVAFCRELLRGVTARVKQHFPDIHTVKAAWVYNFGRNHWEFHGPDKFYWHGGAANAYDARAKGWSAWLASKGLDE